MKHKITSAASSTTMGFFPRTNQGETPQVVCLGPAFPDTGTKLSSGRSCNHGPGLAHGHTGSHLGCRKIPSSICPHSHLLLQAFLDKLPSPLLHFLNCTRVHRCYLLLRWTSLLGAVPSSPPGTPRLLAFLSCPCSLNLQVASHLLSQHLFAVLSSCLLPGACPTAQLSAGPLSLRFSILRSPN